MPYTRQQLLQIVNKELLLWMKKDDSIKDAVFHLVGKKFESRGSSDAKFNRMLEELRIERERQDKKWEEWNTKYEADRAKEDKKWEEQNKKWDEQNKKWDEQNKKWDENQKAINDMLKKIDETTKKTDGFIRKYTLSITAIGSRWGIQTEHSFRDGLKAILEEDFHVKVLRYEKVDNKGLVYAIPQTVEIDVIVHNGKDILCEISASFSQDDVEGFARKIKFYQKNEKKKVSRAMIISPMIDPRAQELASRYGIETYTHPDRNELTFP